MNEHDLLNTREIIEHLDAIRCLGGLIDPYFVNFEEHRTFSEGAPAIETYTIRIYSAEVRRLEKRRAKFDEWWKAMGEVLGWVDAVVAADGAPRVLNWAMDRWNERFCSNSYVNELGKHIFQAFSALDEPKACEFELRKQLSDLVKGFFCDFDSVELKGMCDVGGINYAPLPKRVIRGEVGVSFGRPASCDAPVVNEVVLGSNVLKKVASSFSTKSEGLEPGVTKDS